MRPGQTLPTPLFDGAYSRATQSWQQTTTRLGPAGPSRDEQGGRKMIGGRGLCPGPASQNNVPDNPLIRSRSCLAYNVQTREFHGERFENGQCSLSAASAKPVMTEEASLARAPGRTAWLLASLKAWLLLGWVRMQARNRTGDSWLDETEQSVECGLS